MLMKHLAEQISRGKMGELQAVGKERVWSWWWRYLGPGLAAVDVLVAQVEPSSPQLFYLQVRVHTVVFFLVFGNMMVWWWGLNSTCGGLGWRGAGGRRLLWSLQTQRRTRGHFSVNALFYILLFVKQVIKWEDVTSFSTSRSFTKLSGKTPCRPPISPIHQPASAHSCKRTQSKTSRWRRIHSKRNCKTSRTSSPTLVMMLMISPSLIVSSSSFCASYGKSTLHCSRPDAQIQKGIKQSDHKPLH